MTATLEVGARTARRYGLTRRNRAVRIGSVTRTWHLPETRTVTIRISRTARRRLGRARSFVTTLRVRAVDAANNPSTRSKSIRLRR